MMVYAILDLVAAHLLAEKTSITVSVRQENAFVRKDGEGLTVLFPTAVDLFLPVKDLIHVVLFAMVRCIALVLLDMPALIVRSP